MYSKLYFDKWNEYLFLSAKYLMWVQMDHRGSPTSLPLPVKKTMAVIFCSLISIQIKVDDAGFISPSEIDANILDWLLELDWKSRFLSEKNPTLKPGTSVFKCNCIRYTCISSIFQSESFCLLQLEALGVVFSLEGWRRLAEEPSLFASCSRRSETQQFLDVLPDRHGASAVQQKNKQLKFRSSTMISVLHYKM